MTQQWAVNSNGNMDCWFWIPETHLQVFDVDYRWDSERGYVELPPPPVRPEHKGMRAKRTACGLGYVIDGCDMEFPFDGGLARPRIEARC